MKADVSATVSYRDGIAPSRRAADEWVRRVRGRLLPFYLLLGFLFVAGLIQAWLAHARRSIAYELPSIENQLTMIRTEIDQLHIEAESLKALSRVDRIAQQLGFIRPEIPPVVVPPGAFSQPLTVPPSGSSLETAGSQPAQEASAASWFQPSRWRELWKSRTSEPNFKGVTP